jgi:hypothetical protein
MDNLIKKSDINQESFEQYHERMSDNKQQLKIEIDSLKTKYHKLKKHDILKKEIESYSRYLKKINNDIEELQNNNLKFLNHKQQQISKIEQKIKDNPEDKFLKFKLDILLKSKYLGNELIDKYLKLQNEYQNKINIKKEKITKVLEDATKINNKIKKLEQEQSIFLDKSRDKYRIEEYIKEYKFKQIDVEPNVDFDQDFIRHCNSVSFKNNEYGSYHSWFNVIYQTGNRFKLKELYDIFRFSEETEIKHLVEIPINFKINILNGNVGEMSIDNIRKEYQRDLILSIIPPNISEYLNHTIKINIDFEKRFTGRLNYENKLNLSYDYEVYKNCLKVLNKFDLEYTLIIGLTKYISSFTAALINKGINIKFNMPKEVFYNKNRIEIINMLQDVANSYKNKDIKIKNSDAVVLFDYSYKENFKEKLPINYDILPKNTCKYKKVLILFDDKYTSHLIFNINKNHKLDKKKYRKIREYLNLIPINKSYYGIFPSGDDILNNMYQINKK